MKLKLLKSAIMAIPCTVLFMTTVVLTLMLWITGDLQLTAAPWEQSNLFGVVTSYFVIWYFCYIWKYAKSDIRADYFVSGKHEVVGLMTCAILLFAIPPLSSSWVLNEIYSLIVIMPVVILVAHVTRAWFEPPLHAKAVTWKDLMRIDFSRSRKRVWWKMAKLELEFHYSGIGWPRLEVLLGGDEDRFRLSCHIGLCGFAITSNELLMTPYGKMVDTRITGFYMCSSHIQLSFWSDDMGYAKGWPGLSKTLCWVRLLKGRSRIVSGRTVDCGKWWLDVSSVIGLPSEQVRFHVEYDVQKEVYTRWPSSYTWRYYKVRTETPISMPTGIVPSTEVEFTYQDRGLSISGARTIAEMAAKHLGGLR